MLTLHGMMIWCTHYYDDASYDEHACLSTMMYTWWCTCNDALWCSCTRWWLWLWCKLDAYSSMILIWWCILSLTRAVICCGDALLYFIIYLYAMVFFYALWWCMPCVQHKKSRVTCSVIVYDERYMSSMWQWYLQQIQRLDWHRLTYE